MYVVCIYNLKHLTRSQMINTVLVSMQWCELPGNKIDQHRKNVDEQNRIANVNILKIRMPSTFKVAVQVNDKEVFEVDKFVKPVNFLKST